ncbi:MAG: pilus assembly FimT family protein [Planctomycetota bacterium]|jgi:prepilin-type N-terminal cleavage/methylation domain-containing protein
MTLIYAAQTQTNCRLLDVPYGKRNRPGFTLAEMMVAILLASLLVLMATMNLSGVFTRSSFKTKVYDFASTIQMAANAASESNKRYEVIVDLDLQGYLLREITSPDLSQVLEEEIIVEEYLSDDCWISYVLFDDGDYTSDGQAKFRAGHTGWQYGGKIVLLDSYDQTYSIVVNRLNRTVDLVEGDIEFLMPRSIDEMLF